MVLNSKVSGRPSHSLGVGRQVVFVLGVWGLVSAVLAQQAPTAPATWVRQQPAVVTAPQASGPAPLVTPKATKKVASTAGTTALNAATHEQGRQVYNYRCYFCHGYSGDAKTLATTYLKPPPRDFSNTPLSEMPRERVLHAVRSGIDGTAMKGFVGIISEADIQAVSDFVRHEFMEKGAPNTAYHTVENGWPNHERNALAYPFAKGEIAIDTPWEQLTELQRRGKRLFMQSCITCHDHGKVNQPGKVWESRPVTYPRDGYCTSCHDETPGALPANASHPQRQATHTFSKDDGTVPVTRPKGTAPGGVALAQNFLVHDARRPMLNPTPKETWGEQLYHANCAFCHAGDGTGKGWIGSFLDPHPRDLSSPEEMAGMTAERLRHAILEGIPNTSMPSWKSVLKQEEVEAIMAYVAKVFHPIKGLP